MTNSGLFNVENGFRVAVLKRGYKWTYLYFIDGTKIRCRRIRSAKIGQRKEIGGRNQYSTAELAKKFLTIKTLTGGKYYMSKATRRTLTQIAGESA